MATETTVPIDDKGMLSELMADEPAAEQPREQQAEPERVEQPRDEHGRFAPKVEEPEKPEPVAEVKPEPEQPKDEDGKVPSWRLRELREAREAAERRAEEVGRREYALQQQLQALQRQVQQLTTPKPEPVDFFQNPDGALEQRLSPIEARFAQLESTMRLNTSRALAVATHGTKAVSEMEAAVEKASREGHPEMPLLAAQMRASDDPVGVAMQWHKRSRMMEVTGGDPDAYRQRVLDEAMKDPAFQAKVLEAARSQAPTTRPNIQLPPSLSKIGNAPDRDVDDSDMSDAGIFRSAMR
jgi:hypothetical protein